jgi:hypothetical protein
MPEVSHPEPVPKFVCEVEAAALLNCVAANDFHEHKCLALMKKLRKCIQRERVVKFELEGAEEAAPVAPATVESSQPAETKAAPQDR